MLHEIICFGGLCACFFVRPVTSWTAPCSYLFPYLSGNPNFSTTEKSDELREQSLTILIYSPFFSSLSWNISLSLMKVSWWKGVSERVSCNILGCYTGSVSLLFLYHICVAVSSITGLCCCPRPLSSPDRPSWPPSWKICCDMSSVMSLPPVPEENERVLMYSLRKMRL